MLERFIAPCYTAAPLTLLFASRDRRPLKNRPGRTALGQRPRERADGEIGFQRNREALSRCK